MIPYGRQDVSEDDIEAVEAVLRSDYLTQGPVVPKFERAVAEYVQVKYAVAVNSATSALHIACLALELGQGDMLWTTPISFVASANCALYCGADVDFVDIDPKTYNISINSLEEKLIQAEQTGRLPKVVVPVHFAGQPCDMRAIHKLAVQYGFAVIEDASHAIGGQYLSEPIGNCRFSDITIFSFHPVKIVTTAEGGMALTNSRKLLTKLEMLRSHGITRDESMMTCASEGPWYYQQVALGFNYRMTELQAALGLSQLDRLSIFVSRRQFLANRYNQLLKDFPVDLPWQHPDGCSAFHLYVIKLQRDRVEFSRKEIFERLREKGVGVNVHYIPIHLQPYYKNLSINSENLKQSESYYEVAITLPLYPKLTEVEQEYVVKSVADVLNIAS